MVFLAFSSRPIQGIPYFGNGPQWYLHLLPIARFIPWSFAQIQDQGGFWLKFLPAQLPTVHPSPLHCVYPAKPHAGTLG